ncbi:NAD(P)/FAD-dependent oxidoreductase [Paracoccaceae bacterium Fryx2]|nr:NAD(P)/FAD-dependent oxidoreductase [Paracoccaceae bacterium Fryx2]
MPVEAAPCVAIIGAGPAGLRAAAALVAAGLRPVLLDEAPEPGGQIYRRPPPALRPALAPAKLYGPDASRARALHEGFAALAGAVDHRPGTMVWNATNRDAGGFRLMLHHTSGLRSALDCDALILATGAMDRILPMPGWTLPGVWSLGGAQVMLKGQANLIGRRPVFAGSGPLLYLIAGQYAAAGGTPAAVIDAASFGAKLRAIPWLAARPAVMLRGVAMTALLRARGVPLLEGCHADRIEAADDGLRVHWSGARGTGFVTGDAVAIGHGLKPEHLLADILGCDRRYDTGARQWLVHTDAEGRSSQPGLYLAGDMAGIRGGHAAETAGELTALAALADLGRAAPGRPALRRALIRQDLFRKGMERAFPFPSDRVADLPDETIVCRCEGIGAGDLRQAIRLWQPADVNRLKAMTRCGMGRCQGRLCGDIAAGLLASETGRHVADVGSLRGQAPVKPLPAGRAEAATAIVP